MTATKYLLRAKAAAGALNPASSFVHKARETLTTCDLKPEARAERDELRRVLNTLDAGFWDWDIPTSQVWYSDHILTLAGYDPEDVTSAEAFFKSGVHPDEMADLGRNVQAVIDGEVDRFRGEFRYRHKDGHWLWFESSGQAVIRSETGMALRIFGQVTCIDDLKQQQADAAFLVSVMDVMRDQSDARKIERIATQKLGEYLNVDRVNIGYFDHTSRKMTVDVEWVSDQSVSALGLWSNQRDEEDVFDEAVNSNSIAVLDDVRNDDRLRLPSFRAFCEEFRSLAFVRVPLVSDGVVRAVFVASTTKPHKWQKREISLIKDVAERLWETILRARAEDEQAQSQALLRFALRAAKMSARRLNLDTGEVLLSENFRDMLDDDVADDMPALDYAARVHAEDRERVTAAVAKVQTGRRESEHRYIATDGTERHIAAYIRYDESHDETVQSPRLASTILRNITKKRAAEMEAEQTRLQLLKHQRLSAMGVMASTLAHELNQPLTVAANYLAMIENGFETRPDKVKQYAARAAEKVLEAGLIIRNVRNYAADGAVSRRPENLHSLVTTALSSMFDLGRASNISITNDVADNLTVLVDARMIEHAIVNIVRNAVDALADRSQGRIQITAHRAGEMIDLHIADNGPGMDDDIAVNLFSPFITTKEKGTGLGLPLCRTMVEANCGKISLIRHDARGALFSLTLPCADTAQPIQEGKAL